VSKSTIGSIVSWSAGMPTTATIQNNTLQVTTGLIPELLWEQRQVVTNVTKEEST